MIKNRFFFRILTINKHHPAGLWHNFDRSYKIFLQNRKNRKFSKNQEKNRKSKIFKKSKKNRKSKIFAKFSKNRKFLQNFQKIEVFYKILIYQKLRYFVNFYNIFKFYNSAFKRSWRANFNFTFVTILNIS